MYLTSNSFHVRKRIVLVAAFLMAFAAVSLLIVPGAARAESEYAGIGGAIAEAVNGIIDNVSELNGLGQYTAIMLGKNGEMKALIGPNGVATVIMSSIKFIACGILAIYLVIDIIRMAERGEGNVEMFLIPFLKMTIALMLIVYIDDITSAIEGLGEAFVNLMEEKITIGISKMMSDGLFNGSSLAEKSNQLKDRGGEVASALAKFSGVSLSGGSSDASMAAAQEALNSANAAMGKVAGATSSASASASSGSGALGWLGGIGDAVTSGLSSLGETFANAPLVKMSKALFRLGAKIADGESLTDVVENEVKDFMTEFWEGVPQLLTLTVVARPIVWLLGLGLRVSCYAIFFELAIRKALMPIALCNVIEGSGGMASPGLRAIKKYFGVYIRIAIFIFVLAIAASLSAVVQADNLLARGLTAVYTDGEGVEKFKTAGFLEQIAGPICIYFAALGVNKKAGDYANDVLGVR